MHQLLNKNPSPSLKKQYPWKELCSPRSWTHEPRGSGSTGCPQNQAPGSPQPSQAAGVPRPAAAVTCTALSTHLGSPTCPCQTLNTLQRQARRQTEISSKSVESCVQRHPGIPSFHFGLNYDYLFCISMSNELFFQLLHQKGSKLAGTIH